MGLGWKGRRRERKLNRMRALGGWRDRVREQETPCQNVKYQSCVGVRVRIRMEREVRDSHSRMSPGRSPLNFIMSHKIYINTCVLLLLLCCLPREDFHIHCYTERLLWTEVHPQCYNIMIICCAKLK